MGSFNVACALSSIPIVSGERVGVQIIAPSKYPRSEGLYTKSTELYNLFLSPVYGEYNSYGSLESIESNSSCKILENFFKLPIETILRIISDHRSVYDSCGALYENYLTDKNAFEDYSKPLSEALLSLGFTKVEKSEAEECFDADLKTNDRVILAYRDTEVIVEDNTLTSVYKNGKILDGLTAYKNMMNSTQLDIYSKLTGVYPGVEDENIAKIEVFSNLKLMFFNPIVSREMNSFALEDSFSSYFYDKVNKSLDEYAELHEKFLKMVSQKSESAAKKSDDELQIIWGKYNLLNDLLKDISYSSEYTLVPMLRMSSDDIRDVIELCRAMSYCNRVFMPNFYVSEDDPYDSAIRLNEVTKEILENRKSRY